ncbi:hypothetical protein D3C86_1697430 [compost metagenome]
MPWQHRKYSSNALDACALPSLKWPCLSLNRIIYNFYRSISNTHQTLWERACSGRRSDEEGVSVTPLLPDTLLSRASPLPQEDNGGLSWPVFPCSACHWPRHRLNTSEHGRAWANTCCRGCYPPLFSPSGGSPAATTG